LQGAKAASLCILACVLLVACGGSTTGSTTPTSVATPTTAATGPSTTSFDLTISGALTAHVTSASSQLCTPKDMAAQAGIWKGDWKFTLNGTSYNLHLEEDRYVGPHTYETGTQGNGASVELDSYGSPGFTWTTESSDVHGTLTVTADGTAATFDSPVGPFPSGGGSGSGVAQLKGSATC